MTLQIGGAAKRLILSLLLACGAGGCVYGPPYAAYDGGYAPAYTDSPYPANAYYGYPYARPAYAYPPVTLDFGFSYYDRGSRHHGGRGWGRGYHGGHGHHHGGRGHGHGGRRR